MRPDVDESHFFEVVLGQRACRSFAEDPISDDEIGEILEAATHAPSAENRQPWVFVVVRKAELRAAVGDVYSRAWEGGAREHSIGRLEESLLAEVDKGARGGVAGAPVLIVVCGDTQRGHERALSSSIFPAVQNILLSAAALGLGSALTTLAALDRGGISQVLELPPHVIPMAVVPIGRPSRTLGPPKREAFASKTFREVYGSPW
jgi:nitroreductase